jgi:hypothetical protein
LIRLKRTAVTKRILKETETETETARRNAIDKDEEVASSNIIGEGKGGAVQNLKRPRQMIQ